MNVLVSGASGLVGSALVPHLRAAGHEVRRLVRRQPLSPDEVMWQPDGGQFDPAALHGMEAVVHLGGENIASGRWTAARKARIRASRVESTRLLAGAIGRAAQPPRVFACASAVGIYGSRGGETLTEECAPGAGFLAEVARDWEEATRPAHAAGARVVCLRFGVVLSRSGGALAKMLPVFRLGMGGRVGHGRQYWSWITREDAVRAIEFALTNPALFGPVNVVAPQPVTNAEFTATLANALRRPALFPLPAFAARLALGEMADETLLASARVEPVKLRQAGFRFRHDTLKAALAAVLGGA